MAKNETTKSTPVKKNLSSIKITSEKERARGAPFTTISYLVNGKFETEILSRR